MSRYSLLTTKGGAMVLKVGEEGQKVEMPKASMWEESMLPLV